MMFPQVTNTISTPEKQMPGWLMNEKPPALTFYVFNMNFKSSGKIINDLVE